MPTIDQAKSAISTYLFQNSQAANVPDFSLVTGLAIAPATPAGDAPPAESAAEQIVVFVEDVPDCVLSPVEAWLRAQAPGFAFTFLPTGRFNGLAATGKSVSVYAPSKYNLPPLSAGTLGAVVKAGGKNYGLSSNHILGFNGRAEGVDVIQPGTIDGLPPGTIPPAGIITTVSSKVGTVAAVAQMTPATWPMWTQCHVNPADAALAALDAGIPVSSNAMTVGASGALPPKAPLSKTGRTTRTTSNLWCRGWEGYIDFSFGTYYFAGLFGDLNQVAFAAPGDSGALVTSNNQAVGLVTARAYSPGIRGGLFEGYVVLMCDLQTCLDALAQSLAQPGQPAPQLGVYPD